MRRSASVVGLDQAELVLIAAEVLGADPADVLATADVAVLSGIAARVRTMTTVAAAAAEVLVAVAAGRPFGRSDAAVAWLAAVVLVERNGCTIGGDDDEWVRLVRAAGDGSVGEREVAEAFAASVQHRAGRVRSALSAAWRPRAVSLPTAHPCPACGAPVDRSALWLFPAWAVPTGFELAAACARLRGTHDRAGAPLPERAAAAPERWCPMVLGPVEGGRVPFVAQTDCGPLAFRPRPDGDGFDVLAIGQLDRSDLVGSWASLWARGRAVAHVASGDCRFDIDRTRLDWDRVLTALPAAELVPA